MKMNIIILENRFNVTKGHIVMIFKYFIILIIGIFYSCGENENHIAQTGTVKFGYLVKDSSLKFEVVTDSLISQLIPAQFIISIGKNGDPILNAEKFDLIKVGNEYFSKSILLNTGKYTLEEFLIINSADEAVYIAPKAGSKLSIYVDKPLPYEFEIRKDTETNLLVQVLPAYLTSASDFGYVSFSFEVIIPSIENPSNLNKSGHVLFYTNAQMVLNCGEFDVDIYIDSVLSGTLTRAFLPIDSVPSCNAIYNEEVLKIQKEEGSYNYYALLNCSKYGMCEGKFNISKDSCTIVFLDINKCQILK